MDHSRRPFQIIISHFLPTNSAKSLIIAGGRWHYVRFLFHFQAVLYFTGEAIDDDDDEEVYLPTIIALQGGLI